MKYYKKHWYLIEKKHYSKYWYGKYCIKLTLKYFNPYFYELRKKKDPEYDSNGRRKRNRIATFYPFGSNDANMYLTYKIYKL